LTGHRKAEIAMAADSATGRLETLTEDWLEKVKAARKSGDVPAILALAQNAVDAIEQAIGPDRANPSEAQVKALQAVKRITYNCAADAWPGWEPNTPRTDAELAAARQLAQQSRAVVQALNLDETQQGNAIWLIGALDLAAGRREAALAAFRAAVDLFAAAKSEVMTLMAQGYVAIAAGDDPALDTALAELAASADADASFMKDQLVTARQVFPPAP
jgi:hypothetical protein